MTILALGTWTLPLTNPVLIFALILFIILFVPILLNKISVPHLIGLIIAGPVADRLGVQTWFIIGGVVCVFMGLASYFVPAVMTFEDGRKQSLPSTPVEMQMVAHAADGD